MATGKILLVEDIYFNQVLVKSLLEDKGHDVIVAKNGLEALELIKSEKPDLIVLDLMMPIMDGFKFLEEKKKNGNLIPVVVLSAKNDMESIKKALNLGASDYITKPFNPEDIYNKIDVFIN